MQMAGILAGKDGNRFDPKTNVTRAEMAVILERFVKVLIVGGSSEGWMCNDSGKWMYYENGKAVTGKKKIDGKTYTFNNEGVVAEETKSKESASKPVSKVNTSGKLSIKNILLNLFSSRK
ncbi:MAG: S-layer homology domain-containing protein [Negativibacillus sp.]